ncbi:MAG: type III polyketide synthase [Gammaproteobacteria bacterium]|nr:type III polyketide synthase [Gammaproteobacteria bacterium]
MQSAITAIGVANPPYKLAQEDLSELISEGFHLNFAQSKILKRIYNSSGIKQRYSVLADFCKRPGEFEFFPNDPSADFPTTAQRMAVYKSNALTLVLAAINDCLINVNKQTISHVITVSCTGMYAPGIDIEIIQHLKLSPSTQRTTINFMGCYGAFNGMKVADAICKADPNATVLLVCVELCSIHFQKDFTLGNIISNAIFADGAAAVLIQTQPTNQSFLRLESFYCDIMPQTSQDMAWHIGNFGFEMVLSAYVPQAIKSGIAAFAEKLLCQSNRLFSDIDYFAIHPGGLKILQACEKSLNITLHDNRFSYEVLREYGNMSSATVFFVLRQILNGLSQQDNGKKIFSCAFGPGLTLESMLLEVHI